MPPDPEVPDNSLFQLRLYAVIAMAVWLAAVGSSWYWNLLLNEETTLHDTISRMTSSIERTLLKTRWDQSHASVDVTFFRHDFQDNKPLRERFGTPIGAGLKISARLTGLFPSGKITAADDWEKMALGKVHLNEGEITSVLPLNGSLHLRMLRVVPIGKDCLRCHSARQAKAGGGISVAIPMEVLSLMQRKRTVMLAQSHCLLAMFGLVLIALGYRGLRLTRLQLFETAGQREKAIAELREALSEIKTLSGIIPICASCKKIRDDKGFWNKVETYLQAHSQASFSHGICPDCSRKLYPGYTDCPGDETK